MFIFTLMCITPRTTFSANTIPDRPALAEIVEETMRDFALAVKAEDFTVFYRRISKLWQDQTTKEQLLNLFKSFSDNDIDLTVLKGHSPVFTEKPYTSNEGILFIKGKYEVGQGDVLFTHKYVYEDSLWKLLGININITPKAASKPEPGSIPKEPEIEALVHQTMVDFSQAVKTKDFSIFYESMPRFGKISLQRTNSQKFSSPLWTKTSI